jgi:predicted hydrocarbon binding protein
MRFVKLSREELKRSLQLYEGVMSQACHALLYRDGIIIGEELAKLAAMEDDRYFVTLEKLIMGRGWAEEARLEPTFATFKGSMEAGISDACHRLRGIVKASYEAKLGVRVEVTEVECEGHGEPRCIFKIEARGESR